VLELRAVEARLLSTNSYADAQETQRRAAKAKFDEAERTRQGREATGSVATRHLAQLQANETATLALRLALKRAEQKQMRELEFARLQQRFHNLLAELATQHHAETAKLQHAKKLQAIRSEMHASPSHDLNAVAHSKPMLLAPVSTITVSPCHYKEEGMSST